MRRPTVEKGSLLGATGQVKKCTNVLFDSRTTEHSFKNAEPN
jgi:hypothetical protein